MLEMIKAFQEANLPLVRTKNKAPVVYNWQKLTSDATLWAGNLTTATEVGFVITECILVVDVDPRNFPIGVDSLAELSKAIDFDLKQNAKFSTHTASGGYHLYYMKDHKIKFPNTMEAFKGVEFKQKGQQVLIPGSVLPDGRKYTLIQGELNRLTEIPPKFYEVIGKKGASQPIQTGVGFQDNPADINRMRQLLVNIPPAIEGQNGDTSTFKVCCLGKDYGLSPEVFFELLTEWNDRCEPAWELIELRQKMLNAYSYSGNTAGSHSIEKLFNVLGEGFIEKVLTPEEAAKQEGELIEWESELQLNKTGGVKTTLKNAVIYIKNDENVKDRLAFNNFTKEIEWLHPPFWADKPRKFNLDFDGVKIRYLLNNHNFDIGKSLIEEAVVEISSHRSFHPVKDWLAKLPKWDGVKRLENLITDNFEVEEENIPYYKEVIKVLVCGILKRVYYPGAKFDFMFVLSGETRSGKSTFLKNLAINDNWFLSRQLDGLDPKDYVPLLKGKILIEWQELALFNKHDINSIKAFISTEVDTVREAYRRDATDYKRQFVICGTTNKDKFLLDETGNARFYIVPVKRKLNIDDYVTISGVEYIRSIKENIEQIYSEAKELYEGCSLKLSAEASRILEGIRDNSFSRDEIEDTIVEWLDNIPEECKSFVSKEKVQVNDILVHCLKENPSKARGLSNRVGSILRRLGYTAKSYRVDGKVKNGFVKNI